MLGTHLNIAAMVALEISVFALAVIAFDRYAPKRWVSERHNLALSGFLLLPLLLLFASQPRALTPTDAITPAPVPVTVERTTTIEAGPVGEAALQPVVAARSLPGEETAQLGMAVSWPETLLAVWIAGAGLMIVRLGQDMILLNALRKRSAPARLPAGMNLSRQITLLRSPEIDAPMVAGLTRPVVIVPTDFAFDARSGCVLEHEIAHIARADAWCELFIRVLTAVFWWVLPLHFMHAIVRRTRETLCDARSANVTGAPAELAHALLDAATRMTRVPPLALSAKPTRSTLTARIDHLTSDTDTPRRPVLMRMPYVLPAFAVLAYAATPQLGEARESQERDPIVFIHEEGDDELKGGHDIHVYRGTGDLDLHELEARMEALGAEIEAKMDEMKFEELETRLDAISDEIEARMDAIDFDEFELQMEALGEELEARLSEIDFSEFDDIDWSANTSELNERERARIEAKLRELDFSGIEQKIHELELSKMADIAELERQIEMEVLSKLEGLKELESLAQLSELAALAALKDMPRHPPHPHNPPRPPEPAEPPQR